MPIFHSGRTSNSIKAGWQVSSTTGKNIWRVHLLSSVFRPTRARDHSVKTIVDAERFSIDPELVGKLKQLCRESRTTMFTAVFAVFSLLLSRYSGSQDVVVGSPVADRSHRETENLIGLFLNTIALRVDLTAQPSFRQLLRSGQAGFQGGPG